MIKQIPDLTYENMILAFYDGRRIVQTPAGIKYQFESFEQWQQAFEDENGDATDA
jgi:hypothetical protein